MNYMDQCLASKIDPESIELFMDKWHILPDLGTAHPSLHDYLGMTWTEYAIWVVHPDSLLAIIKARRENKTLCTKQFPWDGKTTRVIHIESEKVSEKEDWEYGKVYATHRCINCNTTWQDAP